MALGLYLGRLAASVGFSPRDLSWFSGREVAARKSDGAFREAAERCWQVPPLSSCAGAVGPPRAPARVLGAWT